jgi:protein required for attachment to host cells
MRQRNIWVVTFDGASCAVHTYDGVPRRLAPVLGGAFAGAHKPHHTDRPVRVFSSAGERRSTSEPRTDPERALEDTFVAGIVAYLQAAQQRRAFDDLIIAAVPRALGAFRNLAPQVLKETVIREIDGDYVNAGVEQLTAALELK